MFTFYKIYGTEDVFVVYEQSESQAALDKHFTHTYFSEMGALLTKVVEGPLSSLMNLLTACSDRTGKTIICYIAKSGKVLIEVI